MKINAFLYFSMIYIKKIQYMNSNVYKYLDKAFSIFKRFQEQIQRSVKFLLDNF